MKMKTAANSVSISFCKLSSTLLGIALLATTQGCTRDFYRQQADKEVNDILAEKDKYPDWKIEQYHVYPDARARFADPTNPDRPPMFPDDPASWSLNPHPQEPGHVGVGDVWGTAYLEMIKEWDSQNRAERKAIEDRNPKGSAEGNSPFRKGPLQTLFDEPLAAAQEGFLLRLNESAELGVINSVAYQNFREELYELALPVTQQRFSFVWQWTAIEDAVRNWAGPLYPGGQANNWNLGTSAGLSKMFSTGALLTAAFANNTVYNFMGGAAGFTSSSTINLTFLQPLLQGGGKAVTLEPLTISERNLLYGIRAYARFREQFYVSVAIGSQLPGSLSSAAGTATGTNPISTLAALGIASTDVSGGFVSYLSTVYRECDMAADKKLARDLEKAVRLFEGLQEGGQVSPLQVQTATSTLYNAQNAVLTDQQFVTNALDQFKLALGLPANLPLILDDTEARAITRQLDRYYAVSEDADAAYKLIEKQEPLPTEKLRDFLAKIYGSSPLTVNTDFAKRVPVSWNTWSKSTDEAIEQRLVKLRELKRTLLDEKVDIELRNQIFPADKAALLRETEYEGDVGELEQEMRRYEARPWEKQPREDLKRAARTKQFRLTAYTAQTVLVWARNERFDAIGRQWPSLVNVPLGDIDLLTADVDLAQEEALKIALAGRWDLMNARGQVNDAWRQIRVTANALLGVLNVGYNLESVTPANGTNPLAFSTAATTSALSLNFQLPLVRVVQRNNYRTALINYQVARRNLMQLEDNIAAQVRFDVRQLQLFAANYKIQKKIIPSLYAQVESSLEVLIAPADPDNLKKTGTDGQTAAAALTNQYLTAIGQLNNAQTKMYDIWLSYLATRMQLYLDLERLQLDNRGVWNDELGNATQPTRADVQPPSPPAGASGSPAPFARPAESAHAEPPAAGLDGNRARLVAPSEGPTIR